MPFSAILRGLKNYTLHRDWRLMLMAMLVLCIALPVRVSADCTDPTNPACSNYGQTTGGNGGNNALNNGPANPGGARPGCQNPLIDDCRDSTTIQLLRPLDGSSGTIRVGGAPLEAFFTYFNMAWPWLLGIASGIAVLQAVIGGVQIMTSGGDIEAGKTRIQWALGGMIMIALAGFILRFLNSIFYV